MDDARDRSALSYVTKQTYKPGKLSPERLNIKPRAPLQQLEGQAGGRSYYVEFPVRESNMSYMFHLYQYDRDNSCEFAIFCRFGRLPSGHCLWQNLLYNLEIWKDEDGVDIEEEYDDLSDY